MTDFHFLRPWWLLAVVPLAALLWAWYRRRRGGGDWRPFCDPALLPHILIDAPGRGGRGPLWLAALAGSLAVLALAGPVWERLPAPVFRNLSALVVVLDLSMAMEAADLRPSRIARARFKIEDLLKLRKDGQTALVAYAGEAFAVTPLTDDAATIASQLAALAPGLMPVQGERGDLGLEAAARLLRQAGLKAGDVLLVAGAIDEAAAGAAAAKLRAEGYRISVLGVGTPEGAPIPLPEGGFAKDANGAIRVPRLDESRLRSLALDGGGIYRRMDSGSADLDALLRFLDRRAEATEQTGNTVHIEQWRESGVWLLPLLLPLAALGFRRGWLGFWLLWLLLPLPEPAAAVEWQDLWLTPDQQAQRAFESGQPAVAAERFRDPAWKAAAEYKAGRYEQAARMLEPQDTTNGRYNLGNALANQGRLEEALRAYDRALELDPGNEDAKYNRKLVEEALRKQQEEQKQKQAQKQSEQGRDQGQQPSPGQQGSQEPGQDSAESKQEPKGVPEQPSEARDNGQDASKDKEPGAAPEPEEGGENQSARKEESKPAAADGKEEQADRAEPVPQDPAKPDEKQESRPVAAEAEASSESRRAEEQWLRRIPDDPAGLLRNKFYYQYRQRHLPSEPNRP